MYRSQITHHLASLAALDVLAVWLYQVKNFCLIFSSEAFVDPVRQRLFLILGKNNFSFFDINQKKAIQQIILGNPSLSLVIIQPVGLERKYITQYLKHPGLNQIILLQPSWLGYLILPGWISEGNNHPIHLSDLFNKINDWYVETYSIGNLSSLLWGFLSGRSLSCNRHDLMDRFNVRMRRNLYPSKAFHLFPLIKIIRFSKDNSLTHPSQ